MNARTPTVLEELAARVGLEPLLTIEELALLARVSRRTIERAIADGRIEVRHLSPRAVRITRSSAAAYLGSDADDAATVTALTTDRKGQA
jgi:excisionase family DNA binding protein